VVSFMPLPLYPRGKSPRYPLDRRLGGPQSEEKKNLAYRILLGTYEGKRSLGKIGVRLEDNILFTRLLYLFMVYKRRRQ
jgi:hypothetical protein